MAISRDTHKLVITIDNVAPADAIALKKMFKYMERLGNMGSSRSCSFYADGDGSFHPKVSFDYPIELPEVSEVDGIIKNPRTSRIGDFYIDSDAIAWKIYHDPEPEGFVRKKNPQEDAIKLNNKE